MTSPHDTAALVDGLRHTSIGPFLDTALAQLPPLPSVPLPSVPLPPLPQLGPVPPAPPAGPPPPAGPHPLPPNPIDALIQGVHLPALPGVDQLMQPFHALLGSFGSGTFGALNPAQIFEQSSKLLDKAMDVGSSALQSLSSAWSGDAAQGAQTTGKKAVEDGDKVSTQGKDIAGLTQIAAGHVQRGQAKIAGIVQSFAATAVATAPIIFTPPGQFALMSSASKHLAEATAVVAETQAALGGLSAEVAKAGGPIQVLLNSGIDPAKIANEAIGTVKPIVSKMTETISDALEESSGDADSDADSGRGVQMPTGPSGGDSTSAAAFGGGSGGGGGAGGGGVGGAPGSAPTPLAAPSVGANPSPTTTAPGAGGAPIIAPGGTGGPMGAGMTPGHGGRGGSDNQHTRSVQPYQSTNIDPNARHESVAPPVLGAEDPDKDADYENDYDYDYN